MVRARYVFEDPFQSYRLLYNCRLVCANMTFSCSPFIDDQTHLLMKPLYPARISGTSWPPAAVWGPDARLPAFIALWFTDASQIGNESESSLSCSEPAWLQAETGEISFADLCADLRAASPICASRV